MRIVAFALLILAASCSGGADANGTCNICPSAKSTNLGSCASQGATLHCASAAIMTLTDDQCNVGQAPTSHQACVFSGCDDVIDCTKIAAY